MTPTSVSTILTDIRVQINPKIRIWITFVSNFGVGGGLLLQTNIFNYQNAVACKGYTNVLSKVVSVIVAVLVVSF